MKRNFYLDLKGKWEIFRFWTIVENTVYFPGLCLNSERFPNSNSASLFKLSEFNHFPFLIYFIVYISLSGGNVLPVATKGLQLPLDTSVFLKIEENFLKKAHKWPQEGFCILLFKPHLPFYLPLFLPRVQHQI